MFRKVPLPLPAGQSCKCIKWSIRWHHQAIEGKRCLEAEKGRTLGALRSLQSQHKLAVEKRRIENFLRNEVIEKLIEDYLERDTAVATKWVEDTERPIMHKQEYMRNGEKVRLTTRKPKKTIQEMS